MDIGTHWVTLRICGVSFGRRRTNEAPLNVVPMSIDIIRPDSELLSANRSLAPIDDVVDVNGGRKAVHVRLGKGATTFRA